MVIFEDCLVRVANAYAEQVEAHGGRSLARVASIAVNHSAFFDRLRNGQTCFVRNLQRVAQYFADPGNWPREVIPADVVPDLMALGISAIGRRDVGAREATKSNANLGPLYSRDQVRKPEL